jgi:hypothetical protein
MIGSRIYLTDMASPSSTTLAGQHLEQNMSYLRDAGITQEQPVQMVSALDVPSDLKHGTIVYLAGSPANHDPDNNRFPDVSRSNNSIFKEEVFYSLCWNTPKESAVAMTYSARACSRLEFWTLPHEDPPRALMVLPAWFATYRPRLGLADTHMELTDGSHTMMAIYAPVCMAKQLQWLEGRIDAAATILAWMAQRDGRLLTFASYTAELEADIVRASMEADRR